MPTAKRRVVAIGGANAERVLVVEPDRFQLGSKHTLRPEPLLAGGSAINHSCRLLATSTPVLPIVPLCHDAAGEAVLATLREAAARGGLDAPDAEGLFLSRDDLATPFTTIVTSGRSARFTPSSPRSCSVPTRSTCSRRWRISTPKRPAR